MSQRPRIFVLLLLLGASQAALSPTVWAKSADADDATEEPAPPVGQDVPRRPLAERVPSVSHRAFTKTGRVELVPALGLSLSDPFYRYVIPAVGVSYHLLESLSIGVSADYYGGILTRIPVVGGAVLPEPSFNKPVFAARFEVGWAPLYGKVSWLAEGVLHFDTYLSAGAGIVSPQTGGASPAVAIALGQHYFFNNWIAFRAELREELYTMARNPQQSTSRTLQSLLSASAGLCFYLPQDIESEDM